MEPHVLLEQHVAARAAVSPAASCSAPSCGRFGSFDGFKKEFADKAAKLFGSGWTWLATDADGKLEIMPLGNADTPLKHGREPVLTLDVWEHAYYIDYRNERPRFIEGFWSKANWDFAAKSYAGPGGAGSGAGRRVGGTAAWQNFAQVAATARPGALSR